MQIFFQKFIIFLILFNIEKNPKFTFEVLSTVIDSLRIGLKDIIDFFVPVRIQLMTAKIMLFFNLLRVKTEGYF